MTGSRNNSAYYWVGNWNQNAVVAIENQTTSAIVRHHIKSIESDPIDPKSIESDPIDQCVAKALCRGGNNVIECYARRFAE